MKACKTDGSETSLTVCSLPCLPSPILVKELKRNKIVSFSNVVVTYIDYFVRKGGANLHIVLLHLFKLFKQSKLTGS